MTPTERALASMSAFVLVFVCLASLALLRAGLDLAPIATAATATVVAYLYVLYKRYRVEIVPPSDLRMFEDVEDLRILCRIYGLDATGNDARLRQRLEAFAAANRDRVFVWVAPMAISAWIAMDSSRLSSPDLAKELVSDRVWRPNPKTRPLIGTKSERTQTRLRVCPICDERAPLVGTTCKHCGADLSLYSALSGSKIGRRLVGEKATSVRRKLRYDAPTLRGPP